MPRFFVDAVQIDGGSVTLKGADAHHVSRSLRMAVGEQITVCDGEGTEYLCELREFLPDAVQAKILRTERSLAEPPFCATVYQALPKGEKLDSIIQKAVECGADEIALFESERCIARIKDGEKASKQERRDRIALEAAKQCGRGKIPRVRPAVRFAQALETAAMAELPLFCYEGEGTQPLGEVLRSFAAQWNRDAQKRPTVSVMVGSEGGFSADEAEAARRAGMLAVGLGPRILRTETASGFVLACLVCELELMGVPKNCYD